MTTRKQAKPRQTTGGIDEASGRFYSVLIQFSDGAPQDVLSVHADYVLGAPEVRLRALAKYLPDGWTLVTTAMDDDLILDTLVKGK